MPRRENTFRVDYSHFPKQLSHDEIHKFVAKELGLTRENVLQLQPSRRLACTFVKVSNLELAEKIVQQHDNKHEFVFDGKSFKLRITMEDGAVEVQFFDLPDSVSNEQIEVFLPEYGDVMYVRDLLWDNRYDDFGGVKTGVRVARVVVTKNIPSLVTIQGEETAVAYKGQRQTCLHCHEFVHIGIPCVQNKKLLVQKLTADQSYANVTKSKTSKPPSSKVPPKSVVQPKLTSASSPPRVDKSSSVVGQSSTSGPAPNLLGASETSTTQSKTTMRAPATKTATAKNPAPQDVIQLPIGLPHRRNEGNETDNSQSSNGCRRSRRQPPGKKMRHSGESTTTNEHVQVSDEEMQL